MERTESKPYKSICSDLYVDAANYLSELVCFRKQAKEEAGTLPYKFWNHPKYKNLYIREVSQARNLLKTYSAGSIIKALDDYRARYILSLRNKKLVPIIEYYEKQVISKEFVEEQIDTVVTSKPLPKKKNILGQL